MEDREAKARDHVQMLHEKHKVPTYLFGHNS